MPLRDSRRLLLERACRAGALTAMALLFFVVVSRPAAARREAVGTDDVDRMLRDASFQPIAQLDVRLTEVPDEATRAWLRALGGAGTTVRWEAGESLSRAIMASEPVTTPDHSRRITVAGIPGGPVVIRDALGVIDSATVSAATSRSVDARVSGPVVVRVQGATLQAPRADSAHTRAVLVLGRAGWESKFTATALEERGWPVETDFLVTPRGASGPAAGTGATVRTRGATAAIDTARYAAVIALDATAASRASAIATFVRAGGGLIIAGGADAGVLRSLAPARAGRAFRETLGGLLSAFPRRGLAGRALSGLRDDALVLERRGPLVMIAARRHELGRVVMLGYHDLWRWRMEGGEMAPDEHRAWWSALVSSVAYASVAAEVDGRGDPAPFAALYASLGPPGRAPSAPLVQQISWAHLLLAACILLLMIEWTSRRLRGAA